MQLTSPVFNHNDYLPSKYTCDGEEVNPPLQISMVPLAAKSLVLIVDDPDAPAGNWVHWLIWNIDPLTKEIPENGMPAGAVCGTTSFGATGYGSPCPPSGVHRYFFKLYALDIKLDLPVSTKKEDLEKAMEGHVIENVELIGLYERE